MQKSFQTALTMLFISSKLTSKASLNFQTCFVASFILQQFIDVTLRVIDPFIMCLKNSFISMILRKLPSFASRAQEKQGKRVSSRELSLVFCLSVSQIMIHGNVAVWYYQSVSKLPSINHLSPFAPTKLLDYELSFDT